MLSTLARGIVTRGFVRSFAALPLQTFAGLMPIMHCPENPPCGACVDACKSKNITIVDNKPKYTAQPGDCDGCLRCVTACPHSAVSLIDTSEDAEHPNVTKSISQTKGDPKEGDEVKLLDSDGKVGGSDVTSVNDQELGPATIDTATKDKKSKKVLVTMTLDRDIASKAASFKC